MKLLQKVKHRLWKDWPPKKPRYHKDLVRAFQNGLESDAVDEILDELGIEIETYGLISWEFGDGLLYLHIDGGVTLRNLL